MGYEQPRENLIHEIWCGATPARIAEVGRGHAVDWPCPDGQRPHGLRSAVRGGRSGP
jgi:hypothetical protein